MAATTIRSHRRQHIAVFVAGLLGIASVLSFMYFSRAQIAETAQSRVRSDSVTLRQALSDQQAAGTDLAKTAAGLSGRREGLAGSRDTEAMVLAIETTCGSIFLNIAMHHLARRRRERDSVPSAV